MSDERRMLSSAAADLLGDLCTPDTVRGAEQTGWEQATWSALVGAGFHLVGVPEEAGGSGGDIADACALLEVAGAYAAPVPLAENGMLGGWALAQAGLALPAGPLTVAPGHPDDVVRLEPDGSGWRLRARVRRVPWASAAEVVVLLTEPDGESGHTHMVSLPREQATVTAGTNLAGEPRQTLAFDGRLDGDRVAVAPEGLDADTMRLRGKLSRCALIAGALGRVSTLTTQYTNTREQFGRPVARFQAVQAHLVRIAEQAQAAMTAQRTAAFNAVVRLDDFDVAAAAVVAGDAATTAAASAHQAHGAIGMTREYELAQLTRRLWSWRDEYGGEPYWADRLGRGIAAAGADALWPRIATGRTA